MTDHMRVEKTDTYQSIGDSIEPLGSCNFDTPRGSIYAVEVPGYTTIMVERDGQPATVMMMLYHPPMEDQPQGAGFFSQMSAASARQVGASLIDLANQIDGGADRG